MRLAPLMASTDEVHDCGGPVEPTVLSGGGGVRASLGGNGSELDERQEWLGVLDELLSLGEGLLAETPRRHLAAARTRVAEDRFNLVVLGEFKRGKSTLINALLRRNVLPTGVVPLTSVVTIIAAGDDDRLRVYFHDGHEEEHPLGELAEYVTEARNPGNRLGVELARVELEHDLLRVGLELVDTPGIGSIHSHNTEVARGFLSRVDAALCVLDAGQPLSEAERELFREAAGRVPRLMLVVNKIDHLDHADRELAVEFIRSALRDLLGGDEVELFPVSARRREGLTPLLARLRKLAAEERHTLLRRSVAQLARGTAGEIAQTARFESRAIELPLDQLASRAEMFDARIAELTAASAEAGDLLERGIERAVKQLVNEPLEHYARSEEARLRAELRAHLERLGAKGSPRELSADLEGWIDSTVRSEFERLVPRFETAIAERLTELEQHYAAAHRATTRAGPASGRGRVRRPHERRSPRYRPARPVALLVQAQGRRACPRHDRRIRADNDAWRAWTPTRDPRCRAAPDRHDRPTRRPPALGAGGPRGRGGTQLPARSERGGRRGGRRDPGRDRAGDGRSALRRAACARPP